MKYNKKYMDMAYDAAIEAFNNNEVPIGCVIVKDNNVLAVTNNLKEKNKCVLDHAELIAIRLASQKLGNWRLDGCDIYITLEPCPMCASAIKQARIDNVYCGVNTNDIDHKFCEEMFNVIDRNDSVNFDINLDSDRCGDLIRNFFDKRRNN